MDSAGQAGEVLRMKEPDGEDLASHTGPESCESGSNDALEALTGVRAGWVLSPVMSPMHEPGKSDRPIVPANPAKTV